MPAFIAAAIIAFTALFVILSDVQGMSPAREKAAPTKLGIGIQTPEGFRAEIFASGLNGPRFLAYGPDGTLFVAERGANRIIALTDRNNDGTADPPGIVADNLIQPSSLAFAPDGALSVGETTRVTRLVLDPATHRAIRRDTVIDNLPSGGHNTRTVIFSPEGKLYVSIGSSCNVCVEKDPRRATVMIYDSSGKNGRVFARGLRNAVGLALQPGTGALWATNNGRDWLGDDSPPETVYRVEDGMDAGWPRCHSGRISDPDFGSPSACNAVAKPMIEMQAHSAPLGLAFYAAGQFPPRYRNGLFIAFHGSWNRSVPTGYKVVFVPFSGNMPSGPPEDFLSGFLRDRTVSGRPVGLAVSPDGSLMVSDDKAGMIYRITYRK